MNNNGASLVEYVLLIVLIAVVCITAVTLLGEAGHKAFDNAADAIQTSINDESISDEETNQNNTPVENESNEKTDQNNAVVENKSVSEETPNPAPLISQTCMEYCANNSYNFGYNSSETECSEAGFAYFSYTRCCCANKERGEYVTDGVNWCYDSDGVNNLVNGFCIDSKNLSPIKDTCERNTVIESYCVGSRGCSTQLQDCVSPYYCYEGICTMGRS